MGFDININLNLNEGDAFNLPTKTPFIDFEKGRLLGYVDGIKAVNQSIRKILSTQRFEFLIYDFEYGCDKAAINYNDAKSIIKSEIERIVKDALLVDERILKVSIDEYIEYNDERYIKLSVETVYGQDKLEVKLS